MLRRLKDLTTEQVSAFAAIIAALVAIWQGLVTQQTLEHSRAATEASYSAALDAAIFRDKVLACAAFSQSLDDLVSENTAISAGPCPGLPLSGEEVSFSDLSNLECSGKDLHFIPGLTGKDGLAHTTRSDSGFRVLKGVHLDRFQQRISDLASSAKQFKLWFGDKSGVLPLEYIETFLMVHSSEEFKGQFPVDYINIVNESIIERLPDELRHFCYDHRRSIPSIYGQKMRNIN